MTEYILNAVGTKYFFRILSNIVHMSTLLGFILRALYTCMSFKFQ